MLDDVIRLVQEKGVATESEGALIVDLEKYGLPPAMLRKKDGATLYLTRDLAAAQYRQRTFNFVKALYAVSYTHLDVYKRQGWRRKRRE